MTDDAFPEAAGADAGGPLAPARAVPEFTIRKVPPPTAVERQARREAMERAIRFGAVPYRDAEGKARYVFFREANNAPVEAWRRDREAKRGYRRTQYARKAAGQMAWHPEDQIELAKRLGVIYHREGRSAEGAAERGLYDAIWRYEHVYDSFTVPRRYGRDIIETGRIAAVAEEEARKLQAEDPKATDGFWVRDRKNNGLIYVVPNSDPEAGADAGSAERAATPEDEILEGGGGEGVLPGQDDAASEPAQNPSKEQEESAVEQTLHYPDISLPPPNKTWKTGKEPPPDREQLPVINMEKDRIENILSNDPAIFEITDWSKAIPSAPIYELGPYGAWAVWLYQDLIEFEAERQGVDPNLIKATIYFENARGGSYGHLSEALDRSDSILPMNIKQETWGGLLGPDADFSDPLLNIRAGTMLLRRIQERVAAPTVAKVSSIYHIAGREKVHDNGARVSQFYAQRPWENLLRALDEPNLKIPRQARSFWEKLRQRREELRRRLLVEKMKIARSGDR